MPSRKPSVLTSRLWDADLWLRALVSSEDLKQKRKVNPWLTP